MKEHENTGDDDAMGEAIASSNGFARTREGYSEAKAAQVLDRLRGGELLSHVCAEPDMPTRNVWYYWLETHPKLQEQYRIARLAWSDWWAEKALTLAMDGSGDIVLEQDPDGKFKAIADHARIQRDRLRCDQIKWMTSKWCPKTYGDRPQAESDAPQVLTISWLDRDDTSSPPSKPEPPKQIVYQKPQLPGDLSEREWGLLLAVLEKIKARTPTNDEKPPAEVLAAVGKAIDALYAD